MLKEWLHVLIAKIITLRFTASSSSGSCQQLTGYIAAVANSALKATSALNPDGNINYGAENSRLFAARNSTHAGGWLARTNTVTYEYITVSREHNTNTCTCLVMCEYFSFKFKYPTFQHELFYMQTKKYLSRQCVHV